jgi:hypothetical protein
LLIDVESGTLYDVSSGTTNLGVMDAYDVKYLTTPTFTQNANEDWVVENYLGEEIRAMTQDEIVTYGSGIESCASSTDRISYNLIMILFAVGLFSICICMIYKGWNDGNITMYHFLVSFIALIVGVIFWQLSGQNLGSAC